jgi:hypothetical protein
VARIAFEAIVHQGEPRPEHAPLRACPLPDKVFKLRLLRDLLFSAQGAGAIAQCRPTPTKKWIAEEAEGSLSYAKKVIVRKALSLNGNRPLRA